MGELEVIADIADQSRICWRWETNQCLSLPKKRIWVPASVSERPGFGTGERMDWGCAISVGYGEGFGGGFETDGQRGFAKVTLA